MDCEAILKKALVLVKAGPISALEAIGLASVEANAEERKLALQYFTGAQSKPDVGLGLAFQEAMFRNAIQAVQRDRPRNVVGKKVVAAATRKKIMADNDVNETAPSADTIASRGKKYTIGEVFQTVDTLGLQVTDQNRKPSCGFQFSRKLGRAGVMDLPANAPVTYVGVKVVYDGQTSSKRMIFQVAQGSTVVLDGNQITLDNDIEVAGVANHVDADDPYNVASRANELKRLEKAALKTQAAAVKSEAA